MNLSSLFQQEERESIEKWCRAHTQHAYLGDYTSLCRVLGDLLMYVDTRDQSLTPHMLLSGFWEMWVTQAIARYVKPGMRCLDIGANCGYYTLLLASLVGATGLVEAWEPYERLARLLEKSIAVNGFSEIASVEELAASNSSREQTLFARIDLLGSSSLSEINAANERPQVKVVRVDEVWDSPVDFVKIDVQGHEMEALEGMRGLIEKSPKIAIALEFSPEEYPDPMAALATIQSYGLSIRTIGTDGMVRHIAAEQAVVPDTGDHRMLWLSKAT